MDRARIIGVNEPVLPAGERLAMVVWRARAHPTDFKNGETLGEASNSSYGAIRDWCRAANIDARLFTLFARFFRATWLALEGGHQIPDLVDIVKPSVLKRDLEMAGVPERPISIQAYCVNQTFISRESAVVGRLLAMMNQHQGEPPQKK